MNCFTELKALLTRLTQRDFQPILLPYKNKTFKQDTLTRYGYLMQFTSPIIFKLTTN